MYIFYSKNKQISELAQNKTYNFRTKKVYEVYNLTRKI